MLLACTVVGEASEGSQLVEDETKLQESATRKTVMTL